MPTRRKKPTATKTVDGQVWTDKKHWTVVHGHLTRGRGRPRTVQPLFKVVAEKIPYDALDVVKKHLRAIDLPETGVYVAHDSMGIPRYIGRGNIFSRLKARRRTRSHELVYFSFYVVQDKVHEREIETLLIRAAGSSLHFNERKKRVDIEPGRVRDYEAGTAFYERQRKKGRRSSKKKARRAAR